MGRIVKVITLIAAGFGFLFFVSCNNNLTTALLEKIEKEKSEIPIPGDNGKLETIVGMENITVSWTKGSDNKTSENDLEYLVCISENEADVATVEEAVKYAFGDFEKDITTKDVTGLLDNYPYWVNVVIRDGSGNKAVYEMETDTTDKMPRMFWTESLNEKVRAARLSDNIPAIDIDTPAGALPAGIAVDGENRRIYWSDQYTNSIYSMDYDGSNISTVIHSLNGVTGIALAPTGDVMFWIESSDRQICSASRLTISGDASTGNYDLITADTGYWPVLIAYDSATDPDTIYWTEYGTRGRIRMAHIDGTGIADFRNTGVGDGSSIPTGIAINGEWIYWTDSGLDRVSKVKTDNSGAVVLVNQNLQESYGIAVTANNNEVLWTDSGTDTIYRAPTSISNADAASYALSINTNNGDPFDIVLDE